MFIGAAMDLLGRKLPTIAGLTICGLCIILMPVSTTLVGLYFLRIFASIGILPASMSPYVVDYIKAESLGVLQGWLAAIAAIGIAVGSVGAIAIKESIGVDYVYFLLGSVVILISWILCFGLEDHKKKVDEGAPDKEDGEELEVLKKNENRYSLLVTSQHSVLTSNPQSLTDVKFEAVQEPKSVIEMIAQTLGQGIGHLKADKTCMIAVLTAFSFSMVEMCNLQYGILIFKQSYEDDEASQDYITNKLAIYLLIAHSVGWVPILGLGFLADHVKVWKVQLVANILALVALTTFALTVPEQEPQFTKESPAPAGMAVVWIFCCIATMCFAALHLTLFLKSIAFNKVSRGLLLGIYGFATTLGLLLIECVGDLMYSSDSRLPLVLPIVATSSVILLTIVFAAFRKLHV